MATAVEDTFCWLDDELRRRCGVGVGGFVDAGVVLLDLADLTDWSGVDRRSLGLAVAVTVVVVEAVVDDGRSFVPS